MIRICNLERYKNISDRYYINLNLEVFDYKNNKIIKGYRIKHGYLYINLQDNCKKWNEYRFHIIVATAFITNPFNKTIVHHVDENKLNNSINNLQWVTSKENSMYYHKYILKGQISI